jgi:hypothetical protein
MTGWRFLGCIVQQIPSHQCRLSLVGRSHTQGKHAHVASGSWDGCWEVDQPSRIRFGPREGRCAGSRASTFGKNEGLFLAATQIPSAFRPRYSILHHVKPIFCGCGGYRNCAEGRPPWPIQSIRLLLVGHSRPLTRPFGDPVYVSRSICRVGWSCTADNVAQVNATRDQHWC